MAEPLEIRADLAACRGARACVRRAPATFSLDVQRKVVIARAAGDPDEVILDAARACPNFALSVFRAGEQLA
jgi:ferredoxin